MRHTLKNRVISGLKSLKAVPRSARARLSSLSRRQRTVLGAVAAVGVLGGVGVAWRGLPDWKAVDVAKEVVALKPSVAELQAAADSQPEDAKARLALGHAAFDEGDRARAVAAYRQALRLDPKVATGRMVSNLLACFGQEEQWAAASLLGKHQLMEAEDSLRVLTLHRAHWVRETALATLRKLGKATDEDAFRVHVADLRVRDCEVRQSAVNSLAELGDRRALDPILKARDRDIEETPWYAFRCLRGASEQAIEKLTRTKFSTRPATSVASR